MSFIVEKHVGGGEIIYFDAAFDNDKTPLYSAQSE